MLFNLAVFLVDQSDGDVQRCRVIRVSLLALLDRILYPVAVKSVVNEFEAQLIAEVFDRRDIIKYLFESLIDEPVIGGLLNFNQIGHLQDFLPPLVAHSNRSAGLYWTNSVFLHSTFHPVISINLLTGGVLGHHAQTLRYERAQKANPPQ